MPLLYLLKSHCHVTLHVSVWVEILYRYRQRNVSKVTLHVSVWVEIRQGRIQRAVQLVTLHVSVWVEMTLIILRTLKMSSRSTWACELKSSQKQERKRTSRHAPRERVSWNAVPHNAWHTAKSHAPRERVSWNWLLRTDRVHYPRHAPRERVSWNESHSWYRYLILVTLHVSVWVEIWEVLTSGRNTTSRSTWACELKWLAFL